MRECTELVIQAQAGDRTALSRLVAAVQDDVWHLLRSRLRNEADAEDAAQETLTQAVVSLHQLREPRAFAGWLFRIALDKARRVRRAAPAEAASEPVAESEAGTMEREETRAQVRRAIRGLDENLRTTVELRYEHGLAYADIARAMECPEGTVADRLHNAHEKLKRALAGVAVTAAFLERELSAAPLDRVPEPVARRLSRAVTGSPSSKPEPSPGRRRGPAVAATAAALLLAVLLVWKWSHQAGERRVPDAGAVASRGGTAGTELPNPRVEAPRDPAHRESQPATAPPLPAQGRVRGRVLDSRNEQGIAGAPVKLRGYADDQGRVPRGIFNAVTDADGSFHFDPPPGRWRIDTHPAGFVPFGLERSADDFQRYNAKGDLDSLPMVPKATLLDVAAGKEISIDLPLMPGLDLCGTVVDEQGRFVEGALVKFVLSINFRKCGMGVDSDDLTVDPLLTGIDGRFEIRGLWPQGHLKFTVSRDGFKPAHCDLDYRDNASEVRFVLSPLPSLRVWGTVRDSSGLAIQGASLYAAVSGRLGALAVPVDEMGRFDQSGAQVEDLVAAWAPGFGPSMLSLAAAGPGGLDFRLPAATERVVGLVLDADGHPLVDVRVRLAQVGVRSAGRTAWFGYWGTITGVSARSGEFGTYFPTGTPAPVVRTDKNGRFVLDGVCFSEGCGVRLSATRDGNESLETDVFEPGKEVRITAPRE